MEETPSHPGGLSDTARKRLDEYRKQRDQPREGFKARNERMDDGQEQRGIGEFQRRANRDYQRGGPQDRRRGWNADDLRSERRGGREDGPSVRVPNVGWDSTPRSQPGDSRDSGWGRARNRQWDAPTPVARRGAVGSREGSPDDGPVALDAREWEEEQVRLDRDWYMSSEGGAVDEEYNPLAQYDDLDVKKTAELAQKQVVSMY